MDKESVADTENGMLLSHKKGWNSSMAAAGMAPEIITLSEASQTEKEKHCMTSLYVESKKI